MKTFKEFRESATLEDSSDYNSNLIDDEQDPLNENLARKGIAAVMAGKAKSHGDAAEKQLTQTMSKTRVSANADEAAKLDATLSAINSLAMGLIQIRKQIGSNTAMLLTLAAFASRTDEELRRVLGKGNRNSRRR